MEKVSSRIMSYFGDLREILGRIVSVSDLSRGKSSKIIQKIVKDNKPYIVVKNNKPQAIIMSIEEYGELMDIKENFRLLTKALQRIENHNPSDDVIFEEILLEEGISRTEVNRLADEVEIE
ncbi:hypothetical protein Y919_10185 [Caloranaerobacter azorensis H53214]|uniref:Antitoxin n=1 Tax=Caloranaerobacter azorensis H53214 TaxID=1156417 RepID=A0A096DKD8_9FIRM|nr:hypothetical protein Y919_10185 [Caloranaerobacter azorensis H53214]